PQSLGANTAATCVFNWTGSAANAFFGSLHDPAIWNAELNPGEILSLHRGGRPINVRRSSLQAWWPLIGDNLDSELDYSGNGRTIDRKQDNAMPLDKAPVLPRTSRRRLIGALTQPDSRIEQQIIAYVDGG